MKIKEIEQEIKDIPLELRKLRATKSDLETENNRLYNEKLDIQGKIIGFKKKQMEENDKLSVISAEVTENIKTNKEILADRNKKLAELMEKESELEGEKAEIAALIEKNRQIEIANIKANNRLREMNQKLQEDTAKVDKDRLKNIAEADQNKARQTDLNEQLKETLKVDKALADKNDDIDKTLEEARAVKEGYEKKVKEVDELKQAATTQISLYKSAEKSYQDKETELDGVKQDLQDEIEKTKAKGISFDRMNVELDNREKRIEIMDLKLQKFARDKGLVLELEELKKSLEPKV